MLSFKECLLSCSDNGKSLDSWRDKETHTMRTVCSLIQLNTVGSDHMKAVSFFAGVL